MGAEGNYMISCFAKLTRKSIVDTDKNLRQTRMCKHIFR